MLELIALTFYSISQLEIPTQERLLPIGQLGKDGMASLVDKVREALSISDIGHLKRDSNDRTGVDCFVECFR